MINIGGTPDKPFLSPIIPFQYQFFSIVVEYGRVVLAVKPASAAMGDPEFVVPLGMADRDGPPRLGKDWDVIVDNVSGTGRASLIAHVLAGWNSERRSRSRPFLQHGTCCGRCLMG